MSIQILSILKNRLAELTAYGEVDAETQRNALKEELQYYVLNFIYHHPQYRNWIMYGGSALRICHGLDRMSVDLDFEISHKMTEEFLNTVQLEIESHFSNTYGTDPDFLTIKIVNGRGLLLRFHIGDLLGIRHPSKQVHVKIDLNYFTPPKTTTERWPINRGQLSFVITTYTMSALMASKIAAIFLRGTRGVGEAIYEEKGRDMYDLLWYMGKKIISDLDYLSAKGVDVKDPKTLFNKLTLQINKVSDANLKQDLRPLFIDQMYIENWLKNWRESYFKLLEGYKIRVVTTLQKIVGEIDFSTDNFSFAYYYETEEGDVVRVAYAMSDSWITEKEGDVPTEINGKIMELVSGDMRLSERVKKYITLFYNKTEMYLKKTHHIMIGDTITTKLIRTTANNLNQKEQIVLDRSALLSCELDDLLK